MIDLRENRGFLKVYYKYCNRIYYAKNSFVCRFDNDKCSINLKSKHLHPIAIKLRKLKRLQWISKKPEY